MLILLFWISGTPISCQVVKLRNLEKAPGAGYEIQTDATGKASWGLDVGGAITVNLTPIAYVPSATGNSSNLNQAVIDPNADIWIIDENGTAIKIKSGTSSAAWSSITGIPAGFADGVDNTADGDSDATNEIQNSNEVDLSTNLVINGGIVTTLQEALEALAQLEEKQQLAINGTTLSITDGQGNVVNSVGLPASGGSGGGTDDQTAAEVAVTPSGNLASSNVQDALLEQQSDIDSLLSTEIDSFDSDRAVLRTLSPGDNIGGSTVQDFLNFFYFAPPTISLAQSPSTSFIEIGTTQQYTFTATTSNPGSATLSNGSLFVVSGDELDDFAATTSGTATIDYTPLQTPADTFDNATYQIRATQSWSASGDSGTATSNTRTIRAGYPVLYGMSATDLHSTGNPYTALTKLVEAEGDKTVTFTGSGFIYFAFPANWNDTALSSIKDPNNFELLGSFTVADIDVSSSGLTNDWTNVPYKIYKLDNTTTTNGDQYQFIQ